MIYCVEILTILGYLFNETLGFLMTAFLSFYIFYVNRKKRTFFEKLVSICILTIPTYNVGFIGDKLHHFLSWTNIYVYIYILYLFILMIRKNMKISKNSINVICFIFICLIFSALFRANLNDSLFNIVQFMIMLIPIVLTFNLKNKLKQFIDEKTIDLWKKYVNVSIVSTAIGVIIQYSYFNITKIIVGQITIYPDRVAYDLLFKAFSVLSFYMGIGITFNVNEFICSGKLKNIIFAVICFIGIILNSARTGLVAAIFTCMLMFIKDTKKIKRPLLTYVIAILALVFGSIAINYMLNNRHTESLLDSNNRMETYIYGFEVLFNSVFNVLFGGGLTLKNYDMILPHNFFLETLATTGLFVTSIVFGGICILLKYLKLTNFKYIVWHILIGSMFITNFQGNTFATIFFIMAIVAESFLKGDKEYEKDIVISTSRL